MGSPFAAAIAAAAATSDAIMGDDFQYRPMANASDVNKRRRGDPDRAVVTIRGIFGEPSARVESGPVKTVGVKAERPGHASERPFVSIRLSQLPYDPQDGDVLVRLSDGVTFSVAEILPDGQGLARLDLNRRK